MGKFLIKRSVVFLVFIYFILMISSQFFVAIAKSSFITVKNPSRYIKPIFEKVDVEKNICFKNAYNDGEFEKLYLDLYQPSGDTEEKRPVIIWIHGGGLVGGDKGDGFYRYILAPEFARRGYVTLSINYRLKASPPEDFNQALYDASNDAAAAVSWVTKNCKKYRMDKNHIAVGGHSNGSDISNYLAYINNEKADWNRNSLFAVISLSGNSIAQLPSGIYNPPCLFIHGTDDDVIPYPGEETAAAAFRNEKVDYVYHTVANIKHDLSPVYYEVLDVTSKFLYKKLTNMDTDIKIREGQAATYGENLKIRLVGKKTTARQIEFKADGKLDEWGNSELIELNSLKDAGDELPPKNKFNGTAMIGWNKKDSSRLYFAATIMDDYTEHTIEQSNYWWRNSSLEVMFDFCKEGYYPPVVQLGFDADGKRLYASAASGNLQYKMIHEGNKYIYEGALELSKLDMGFPDTVRNHTIKPGDVLGLSIQYNKCRAGLREYQIGWTPDMTWDTKNFGNVVFVE